MSPLLRRAIFIGVFAAAFALRVHGIWDNFWLLRDQIRDWGLVLGPFRDLPLVGPATHVGGYTIGPAFYWILWTIRVLVGPWFDNLPHAGGIGQAALQSAVDVLLLAAVWRRTGSVWLGLAVVGLLVTASFDLSLAAIIWNPVVGATLAKCAVALVLLDWHKGSPARVAAVVAVAWAAVHAYTAAIYVATAVFAAILIDPALQRNWRRLARAAAVIAVVVGALQIPYVWYRFTAAGEGQALGAVSESVVRVATGRAAPQIAKSLHGLAQAFADIEGPPLTIPWPGWVLAATAALATVRYRRDPAMLAVTVLPLALAIAGFALFLGNVEDYNYLSLMTSAMLTVVLGAAAFVPRGAARGVAIALCAAALAMTPWRARAAVTVNRMPEYRVLVRASRVMARRGTPLRAIRTELSLPPTADASFLFQVLGGRIVHGARWMATIGRDGTVTYQDLEGS